MEACARQLDELGIDAEIKVCSAHRDPKGVMEWASSARDRGLKVVIAAAGGAAHLPGVVAAWTDLPVIGVPVPTQHLGGVDSLYSIVQMPAGIPVATVAIGEAGAKNAAWLAARILAIEDPELAAHGQLCYSLGPSFTGEYWKTLAKRFVELGCEALVVNDAGWQLDPSGAAALAKALAGAVAVPVAVSTAGSVSALHMLNGLRG